MDSAFCVAKAMAELVRKRVYSASVVKKRKYWPKHIPGDAIMEHMQHKPIGELHVKPTAVDGIPMSLWCVRHARFTFIVLATYGAMASRPTVMYSVSTQERLTVQRNNVFDHYYRAKHAVDDNNHLRQGHINALEASWASKRWIVRQFAFIVALAQTNALVYHNYRSPDAKMTAHQFGETLASELLDRWVTRQEAREEQQRSIRQAVAREHHLVKVPANCGAWTGNAFKPTKQKHQKQRCRGKSCPKTIRTHCSCNPMLFFCDACFAEHVAEEAAS